MNTDCHILGIFIGIFNTRLIRRFSIFIFELLGKFNTYPWKYGYTLLGHKILYTKWLVPPIPTLFPIKDKGPVVPSSPDIEGEVIK